MAIGSDNDFPALADFVLNQILGYQDVNDMKSRSARLRDAFNRAHAWNDNAVGNVAWDASAESHASTVDLGQHSGNIGVAAGTGKTVYFGSGANLTGIPGPAVSGMKGAVLISSGTGMLNAGISTTIITETVAMDIPRFHWTSVYMSTPGGGGPLGWGSDIGNVGMGLTQYRLTLTSYAPGGWTFYGYKVYSIDEA